MPDKPYEFLDHTADIRARIYGKNLSEIFINAARAMFDVLAQKHEGACGPRTSIRINLTDNTREELLIRWLNELLFLYADQEIVFSDYQIDQIGIGGLQAVVTGESSAQYRIKTEIKAATYHELAIRQTANGWEADVIFDV